MRMRCHCGQIQAVGFGSSLVLLLVLAWTFAVGLLAVRQPSDGRTRITGIDAVQLHKLYKNKRKQKLKQKLQIDMTHINQKKNKQNLNQQIWKSKSKSNKSQADATEGNGKPQPQAKPQSRLFPNSLSKAAVFKEIPDGAAPGVLTKNWSLSNDLPLSFYFEIDDGMQYGDEIHRQLQIPVMNLNTAQSSETEQQYMNQQLPQSQRSLSLRSSALVDANTEIASRAASELFRNSAHSDNVDSHSSLPALQTSGSLPPAVSRPNTEVFSSFGSLSGNNYWLWSSATDPSGTGWGLRFSFDSSFRNSQQSVTSGRGFSILDELEDDDDHVEEGDNGEGVETDGESSRENWNLPIEIPVERTVIVKGQGIGGGEVRAFSQLDCPDRVTTFQDLLQKQSAENKDEGELEQDARTRSRTDPKKSCARRHLKYYLEPRQPSVHQSQTRSQIPARNPAQTQRGLVQQTQTQTKNKNNFFYASGKTTIDDLKQAIISSFPQNKRLLQNLISPITRHASIDHTYYPSASDFSLWRENPSSSKSRGVFVKLEEKMTIENYKKTELKGLFAYSAEIDGNQNGNGQSWTPQQTWELQASATMMERLGFNPYTRPRQIQVRLNKDPLGAKDKVDNKGPDWWDSTVPVGSTSGVFNIKYPLQLKSLTYPAVLKVFKETAIQSVGNSGWDEFWNLPQLHPQSAGVGAVTISKATQLPSPSSVGSSSAGMGSSIWWQLGSSSSPATTIGSDRSSPSSDVSSSNSPYSSEQDENVSPVKGSNSKSLAAHIISNHFEQQGRENNSGDNQYKKTNAADLITQQESLATEKRAKAEQIEFQLSHSIPNYEQKKLYYQRENLMNYEKLDLKDFEHFEEIGELSRNFYQEGTKYVVNVDELKKQQRQRQTSSSDSESSSSSMFMLTEVLNKVINQDDKIKENTLDISRFLMKHVAVPFIQEGSESIESETQKEAQKEQQQQLLTSSVGSINSFISWWSKSTTTSTKLRDQLNEKLLNWWEFLKTDYSTLNYRLWWGKCDYTERINEIYRGQLSLKQKEEVGVDRDRDRTNAELQLLTYAQLYRQQEETVEKGKQAEAEVARIRQKYSQEGGEGGEAVADALNKAAFLFPREYKMCGGVADIIEDMEGDLRSEFNYITPPVKLVPGQFDLELYASSGAGAS